MQNQYGYPPTQYQQPQQQPCQQPYQQHYGPPQPGYSQSQPYQQPAGPGGYGYADPNNAGQYYQQGQNHPPPTVNHQSPPLPSPQLSQQHAPSVKSGAANAFPHLCAPGTNTIALTIVDKGDKKDFVVAPGAPKTQPLYTSKITKSGTFSSTKAKIQYHDGQSKKPKTICKLKYHEHYVELAFPWLKWDLWPFAENNTYWGSDVGTRQDHSLEWKFMGGYKDKGGFVIRLFDVDEAYEDVCNIVMTDHYSGTIEIDALSLKNQDALDEMVTVALATLDVYRGQQSAPDRAGMVPSSSSSSDSD
ncbi:hypothetical protein LTR84_006347 [Exophiala bonariae]|uniref:Uncharacterized protein n=1 Tax=Exophiala bonariae TaxID=1690606 RepID=A0AAV9N199_9EURO|nr:hypothetical protein LTR84_006347 [Exophiala bonariae]